MQQYYENNARNALLRKNVVDASLKEMISEGYGLNASYSVEELYSRCSGVVTREDCEKALEQYLTPGK